jgi:predicted lipoprotein with Yx(FWY)xxD motif
MKRHLFIVLAAAALLLAACGDDSSSDDSANATSDTTASSETTAPSSDTPDYGGSGSSTTATTAAGTGTATGAEVTVALADVGDVGQALVGPDGRTLYLFEQDNGTTSACTEGCAEIWPALTADGAPSGGDGVDASLLSTAEGQVPDQVVYNGHLLYYFSGDTAPGDVNGLQIPSWYPVDADGNAIDAD